MPKVAKKMPKIQKVATWTSKVAPARYLIKVHDIFTYISPKKMCKKILINRSQT
jgi:hypothetical protein